MYSVKAQTTPSINILLRPTKKKQDLADAIREFGNQPWRSALADRKQGTEERKLHFLEEKESRKAQLLQKREQREEKSATLQNFAFVSDWLRSLYRQQDEATSARIREDLDEEIAILKTKKRKLVDEI